jgi:uncharacterized protein
MATVLDVVETIKAGDVERLTALLVEDPALAAARDGNGVSMLMLALYHGRPGVVDVLRPHIVELDIFEAAALDDAARVRELLAGGPDLAHTWSTDRATALHFAAFFGSLHAADVLLQYGADPRATAPGFGNVQPLHSAAAGGHTEVARLLLDRGVDANAQQNGGFAPLHAAAANGNRPLVELLLARGADPHVKTDDGRTAVDFARSQDLPELVDLMTSGGRGR